MEGGDALRPSRWCRAAREAVPVLILLAVAAKSAVGEWRARDLAMTDETAYLSFALDATGLGRGGIESGPLYVQWYRLLMHLPVPVEYLPFVSHGLLQAVLAVLFYALVRRLGTGRWAGATAASVLVLNTQLAALDPFPMHLATALLAVGVLAGTYRRSVLGACGPVGFGALAACYARPEFGTLLLVFLPLYLAGGVWACARGCGRWREFVPWAVPLVAAVGLCGIVLGLPLPDGARGWAAFAQHYGRNVEEATGSPTDWGLHWDRAARADFGAARTLGEAVRARPDAMAWHVGRNLVRLPNAAFSLCRPMALAATPRKPAQLLLVAGLGVGFVGLVRRVQSGGLRGPAGQPLRAALLALACVAVISGPAVLIVYPRDHYLLLPLFFLLALAVSGLPVPRWPAASLGAPDRWKVRAVGSAAGALLVILNPTALNEWTPLRPLLSKARPAADAFESREIMALLHALPPRPLAVVMDHSSYGSIRSGWMASPVFAVAHDRKAEGFRAFVAKHQLGVIVLDHRLPSDARYGGDAAFMALWDETDTGDFVVRTAPGGARIAVRKDLLE